jgi:hypothetical protein
MPRDRHAAKNELRRRGRDRGSELYSERGDPLINGDRNRGGDGNDSAVDEVATHLESGEVSGETVLPRSRLLRAAAVRRVVRVLLFRRAAASLASSALEATAGSDAREAKDALAPTRTIGSGASVAADTGDGWLTSVRARAYASFGCRGWLGLLTPSGSSVSHKTVPSRH